MMVSAVQSSSGEMPKLRIGAAKPETCSIADLKTNRPVAQLKTTATSANICILLNDCWRVRLTDPLQWILERRRGRSTRKSTGWQGRRFCIQRTTLLRDIGDYCGDVDPVALSQVEELPERFQCQRRL